MESSFTKKTTSDNNFLTNEKVIKKDYSFERIIKAGKDEGGKEIVLYFNIILYENEIMINVKGLKDNLKSEVASYKKNYSLEELKYKSKFFCIPK